MSAIPAARDLTSVLVVASSHKPEALPVATQIVSRLEALDVQVKSGSTQDGLGVQDAAQAELVVSVGGDGTLLDVARRVAPAGTPVLGVNLGKLGFLAGFSYDEFNAYLEGASPEGWRCNDEIMLEVDVNGGDRRVALNDVAVSQGIMTRLVELDMWIGQEHAIAYRADGLVVSTPVGSTAYSLSLGGPILGRGLQALVVTPMAPHSLTNRPIVVDAAEEIEFEVRGQVGELALLIDGQERIDLHAHDRISIRRSPHQVTLVSSGRLGPYGVLREKLGWGLGPALTEY